MPNGSSVDWIAAGAVTNVLSQGACPASYAFAAIGALEGLFQIIYKNLKSLSVQQVIDCSGAFGNDGCSSGRIDQSLDFALGKGRNLFMIRHHLSICLPLSREERSMWDAHRIFPC